ncbi:hypothetical protein DL991_34920 [Amycolatopsis sp. WAC 01375]|uniref:hypothetical protein n=1 Tax=unclassified Amycolatopsis TaxID=2618356 RepID=UPI000F77A915|nr:MULTISPECIES: hypothetical protein [unclassified Amycolatopsis]RSM71742.1 hypothetical protein DL991_34920 [Amycolatopsis sp. WAC 01375]RSN29327.1 hypothetical protein DL990_24215 [Amycolatopsis sp. WAC 01416]
MGNERPRYWFPLALLGFAQLAVVALSVGARRSEGWFAYAPYANGGMFGSVHGGETSREALTAVSVVGMGRMDNWLFAVLAVYLGTVLFYAFRAKTVRWWKVAGIALGGLVAIVLADLVGYWELDMDGDARSAVLLTLGLVGLAWLERSVLVLVVAAAFVLCAVVLARGQLALVLSSLVALAGAFAALLSRPKTAAEEA